MSDYRRRRYRFSRHGRPGWTYPRIGSGQRRSCTLERPFKFSAGEEIKLEPIIHPENLLAIYSRMEHEAGQAPGPDGVHFGDLGRRERADILRAVGRTLADGTYRPGPARHCDIPKSSGGTRTLTIRNTIDRVISKAALIAIEPVIDPRLADCSMGFRPGRSIDRLLAELEACVLIGGRWIIVTDDIRKAFDNVPVASTISAIRQHIPDEATMELMEKIIRGHDGAARQIGIDQGDPLSPLVLNILLNQVLDRPLLAAHPGIPFWRYADNLVWCCQDVPEGHRILQQARQLLDVAGFALKGDFGPVDLRRQGAHVKLLGFRICRRGKTQLHYELTKDVWRSLRQSLIAAHEAPHPAKMANMVISGWLEAYGPVFGGDVEREILDRVRGIAVGVGFREFLPMDRMIVVAGRAGERWRSLRDTALFRVCRRQSGPRSPSSSMIPDALRAPQSRRSLFSAAAVGLVGS